MDEIIINYLKGEASASDLQKLTAWLNESSENKLLFDQFNDIWLSASVARRKELKFNAVKGLKSVKRKILFNEHQRKHRNFINLSGTQYFLRVAAIIIVTFGLSYLTFWYVNHPKNAFKIESLTEITAPLGSKSKITLPDGTKVWLNAGSTLCFSSAFNKLNREIKLNGEAYFDVTKNKSMAFIVQTPSHINIKVLGTAFNLKAYQSDGLVETTLVRGSLIVEEIQGKQKKETILAPNQRATYIASNHKNLLSAVDIQTMKTNEIQSVEPIDGTIVFAPKVETELFTSWKDNKLIFRNESFENLVIKLERWYGVKITVDENELNNFHFNGTIENETINDVFNIISTTIPIKYTIQHNVVYVSKK